MVSECVWWHWSHGGWVSEVQVCAVAGCSSGRITFFLWTSELSLIGGVSLSLKKKKKDDSINVSRIDGLKEEIRKKGMNEQRV